ncbi:LysR family transcriptional regulator [Oceanobacillus piezotolerans]|uniref:LysR family transcriptional regulator n=1 Tax=Oceanobacillus piezotolerans TaxID=2448030 RepID=A0A498DH64_9BACI|nr:LysR family transcriptional regulator [Oceanobacillus piezotolerans]RLL44825.1 LysR family transcriptional regulator [Oceanobacillus piezotolerans]
MNESQIETFLTVATYRSFSKAAAVLNVTQPTITSRLKNLEEILQCELFKRIGHEIFLTKEGNVFMEYAKNILIYMKHSKEISGLMKEPVIKVGFSPGYSYSFIVEMLKTIQSAGDMDIQVKEGFDSVNLSDMVLAGELDLVFTRNVLTNKKDIVSEPLFDNPLIVVLPKNHPLAKKQVIQLKDLCGETILSYRRKSTLWNLIDRQLLGIQPTTRIDLDNNEMLMQAVMNRIGIGIIPELGMDKRYAESIAIRSIPELQQIPNKVYVQYRKNTQIQKLSKKIIYSIINHKYKEVH